MKKILFLTAMVIIALGFTACTDDNPTQQGQQTSDIDILKKHKKDQKK